MDEDLRTQIVARGGLVPLLRLSSSDDVEIQMEVCVFTKFISVRPRFWMLGVTKQDMGLLCLRYVLDRHKLLARQRKKSDRRNLYLLDFVTSKSAQRVPFLVPSVFVLRCKHHPTREYRMWDQPEKKSRPHANGS